MCAIGAEPNPHSVLLCFLFNPYTLVLVSMSMLASLDIPFMSRSPLQARLLRRLSISNLDV